MLACWLGSNEKGHIYWYPSDARQLTSFAQRYYLYHILLSVFILMLIFWNSSDNNENNEMKNMFVCSVNNIQFFSNITRFIARAQSLVRIQILRT